MSSDDLLDVLGGNGNGNGNGNGYGNVVAANHPTQKSLDELDDMMMHVPSGIPSTFDVKEDNNNNRRDNKGDGNKNSPSRPTSSMSMLSSISGISSASRMAAKARLTQSRISSRQKRQENKRETERLPPNKVVTNIEDEPDFQKDIYAADFVDFDPSTAGTMVMTPRIIRPPTMDVNRPTTADTWISSTPSTEVEVPHDTYVDETRLYKAFQTVRDKFVLEMEKHNDTQEAIAKLKKSLELEGEVNSIQLEQLKKEERHTSKISSDYNHLVKEHTLILEGSEEEIEDLYRQIREVNEMTERVKSERMQFMFRNQKARDEMDKKIQEIKRMEEIKSDTAKDTEGTSKENDRLQKHLRMQSELGKSADTDLQEYSWKLQNSKKLVDELIARLDKAEEDARTWEHRYKVLARDLSHIQKMMMNMTSSHTETQAILYRDRALHYLKSFGGGGSIKESLPPVGLDFHSQSLLSDALKDPMLRKTEEREKEKSYQEGSKLGMNGGVKLKRKTKRAKTPMKEVKGKIERYLNFEEINVSGGGGLGGGGGEEILPKTREKGIFGVARDKKMAEVKYEINNSTIGIHTPANLKRRDNGYDPLSDDFKQLETTQSGRQLMSQGSALQWKTGSINNRRQEADLKRESWIGGGENFFDEKSKTVLPFSMMSLPESVVEKARWKIENEDPFANIE